MLPHNTLKSLVFLLFIWLWAAPNCFGQVLYEAEPSVQKADENRKIKIKNSKKINGFRIFIGFSNKRAIAQELLTKAEEKFATTYGAQIIFDEPNFKVYIGAFTTQAEVDAALVEVRKEFPTARKLKMPIPNPNYTENPEAK